MITLAEQAEAFIEEQTREMQDSAGGSSLSRTEYNAGHSRNEWADQWRD